MTTRSFIALLLRPFEWTIVLDCVRVAAGQWWQRAIDDKAVVKWIIIAACLQPTGGPMKTKPLLAAIAVAELGAGLGLLVAPAIVVELLLGQPLGPGVALVVGRVAGIALLAIGLMCWLQKSSTLGGSLTGLLIGLLVYNSAVAVLLIYSFMTYGTNGLGLWPVVVLHLTFAVLLATSLRSSQ